MLVVVGVREALKPGDPRWAGPYELLERLGQGGMGQVFLGRSPGGRPVAVKLILAKRLPSQADRARFAREVLAARRVNALFTAPVVDADPDAEVPWLVTAYVPGPSLDDAVTDHGPLRADVVRSLAAGLAEGLAAIHAVGVVHRDLKPSNVLLADDGPRIIDFGISRAIEATALTGAGQFVGTPAFMSPEQAEGRDVGPASDVFSLGSVLTFAATGTGPFRADTLPALIYQVMNCELEIAGVSGELRPLVRRCLAKDPGDRPTPAQIMAELGPVSLLRDWLPPAVAETLPRYRVPGVSPSPPPNVAPPQADPPARVAMSVPTETAVRPPNLRAPGPAAAGWTPAPGRASPQPLAPQRPPPASQPWHPPGSQPWPQPPSQPWRTDSPPATGYRPGGLVSGSLPPEYRFGWLSVPFLLFLAVAAFVAPLEVLYGLIIAFAVTVVVSRVAAAIWWSRRPVGQRLAGSVVGSVARDAIGAVGLALLGFGGLFVAAYWLLPAVGPGPGRDYPRALSSSGPADPFASLSQAWWTLHLLLPLPVVAMTAVVLFRTRADLRRPLMLPRAARLLNAKAPGVRVLAGGVPLVLAMALIGLNGGLSATARPRGAICSIAPLTCAAVTKIEAASHHRAP